MNPSTTAAFAQNKRAAYLELLKLAERLDLGIDVPRMIFVGSAQSGKSSLLQLLTGVNIRGMGAPGITTTCPVRYCLRYDAVDKPRISVGDMELDQNSGETLSEVIAQRMGVVRDGEVEVQILASNVWDMDVIDLPGIDHSGAEQLYREYMHTGDNMGNVGVVLVVDAADRSSLESTVDFMDKVMGGTRSSWRGNAIIVANKLDLAMVPQYHQTHQHQLLAQKKHVRKQSGDHLPANPFSKDEPVTGNVLSAVMQSSRQQKLYLVCAKPFGIHREEDDHLAQSAEEVLQEESRLIKQWRTRLPRHDPAHVQDCTWGLSAAREQFERIFYHLFAGSAVNQIRTHLRDLYEECNESFRTYSLFKNHSELRKSLRDYSIRFRDLLIGVQRATADVSDLVPIQQYGQTFVDEITSARTYPHSQYVQYKANRPLFTGYNSTQWAMADSFKAPKNLSEKMDQLLLGAAQLERLYHVFVSMLLRAEFRHFSDSEILSFASSVERDSSRLFSPEKAIACMVRSALRLLLEPGIEWFSGMLLYLIDSKREMVQQVLLRHHLKHLAGFTAFHSLLAQLHSDLAIQVVNQFRDRLLKLADLRMNTANVDILEKTAILASESLQTEGADRDKKVLSLTNQGQAIESLLQRPQPLKCPEDVTFMSSEYMDFLRERAQKVFMTNLFLLVIDMESEYRAHVLEFVQQILPLELYDKIISVLSSEEGISRAASTQVQSINSLMEDLSQRQSALKTTMQRLASLSSTMTSYDMTPSANMVSTLHNLGSFVHPSSAKSHHLPMHQMQFSDQYLISYSNTPSFDIDSSIAMKRIEMANSFQSNDSNRRPNVSDASPNAVDIEDTSSEVSAGRLPGSDDMRSRSGNGSPAQQHLQQQNKQMQMQSPPASSATPSSGVGLSKSNKKEKSKKSKISSKAIDSSKKKGFVASFRGKMKLKKSGSNQNIKASKPAAVRAVVL